MGSKYKDEKKRIKERFDDKALHNGYEDDFKDDGVDMAKKKFLEFEQENELDERSRSFRMRSAEKNKKKAKSAEMLRIIKRSLAIFLFISAICITVYLVSRVLARNKLKIFRLEGRAEEFEKFIGLPEGVVPRDLGAIELKNVFLNASDLIECLKDCSDIRRIRLENVKVRGEWSETVLLPQLEEFVYAESSDDASGVVNVMDRMTEARLKSILFFRTSGPGEGKVGRSRSRHQDKRNVKVEDEVDLEKLWDLDPDVNVTLDGHTILVVNHTRGELVLPWLPFLKREEIIRHAGRDLRRLSCNRLKLNIEALPPKMTHLTLRDVKLGGGDFGDLCKKLSRLVQLRVSFPEYTQVDLGILPRKTLRDLTLSRAQIMRPLGGKKFKLEQFTLISSNISASVARSFADTFHGEKIALGECNILDERPAPKGETEAVSTLLLAQLLEQSQLENMYMYKYKGKLPTESNVFGNTQFNSTGPKAVSNFLLARKDGEWEARALSWNEWSIYKHHVTGFERFWQLNESS